MINNPSSEDLVKAGWSDYKNLVILTDSYEKFTKFYDNYCHFMYSVEVEQTSKLIIINFTSNFTVDQFTELIKKTNLVRFKCFESETPVITLNEILDKINENGEGSLTLRERRFLESLDYIK